MLMPLTSHLLLLLKCINNSWRISIKETLVFLISAIIYHLATKLLTLRSFTRVLIPWDNHVVVQVSWPGPDFHLYKLTMLLTLLLRETTLLCINNLLDWFLKLLRISKEDSSHLEYLITSIDLNNYSHQRPILNHQLIFMTLNYLKLLLQQDQPI